MPQEDLHSHPADDTSRLHDAERVMARLLLAAKNLGLYPEDHTISRNSLQDLHDQLTEFINHHGEFELEVYKTHTEYQGNKLFAENSAHLNLAYLCYRDGIQRLIFSRGITCSELEEFLKIINTHQVMEDENQGDIVTDLWQAGLFNIEYRTNERIWQNEDLLDLSRLSPVPHGAPPVTAAAADSAESALELDNQIWQLTDAEIEETSRMVALEESRNFNQDVFDVLLVILNEQRAHKDYAELVEIIYECFVDELSKRHFSRISKFLKNFHAIRNTYKADRHWALPYLDDFLGMISGRHALASLNDYLAATGAQDQQKLRDLEEMLKMLSAECILNIGPVLPKIKSPHARRAVVSALRRLAEKDLRPLIHLARNEQAAVASEAIMILSEVRSKKALPLLFEASRSDEDSVRKTAVSALTRQKSADDIYPHLVSFFSDSNPGVRKIVFNFFSRGRSPEAEKALIERISRGNFTRRDTPLLKDLYQALGNCGGAGTIDFLQSRLFSRPLRIGKVRSMHRAGAAMALSRLKTPEAENLLIKASKSFWPTIRRAAGRAKDTGDEA
ncbi:MAG: HEAT repeat domain-containing protein [Desulfosalsimonas sp.]